MSKVQVCSAIMGSGKSSGARSYALENQDKKYIYVAPFLDEARKFAMDCAPLNFVEPEKLSEFNRSKIKHIEHLVKQGANISSTHAAFAGLTNEALEDIAENKYTLICDETVDAVRSDETQAKDLILLERAGMLRKDGEMYRFVGDDDYIDGESKYTDLCRLARSNNVVFGSEEKPGGGKNLYYYLLLPPEFIKSFERVIVLTYMFESSNLCALFKLYGIDYEYIGIERIDYGNGYMLSPNGTYVPDYIYDLKNKIHIHEDGGSWFGKRGRPPISLNTYDVGGGKIPDKREFKPTYNFFKKKENEELFLQLKNNQRNFFDRLIKQNGGSHDNCMWSTYEPARKKIESRGLREKWVAFNSRATNDYCDRNYLSYIVDPHFRPELKQFYIDRSTMKDNGLYRLPCNGFGVRRAGKEMKYGFIVLRQD